MTDPRYSIIIPAHNEEWRISPVLNDYADQFRDSEILVVLNGCTDATQALTAEVSRIHPHVRQVVIDHAVGKGGAVRAGALLARAPVIGYVDADGATSATEFRRLCGALNGYDAVIGSRWLPGSNVKVSQPWLRRLASRVFNMFVKALFGLPFQDTQCGAKIFDAGALKMCLPKVETSNLAFDVDILYALHTHDFSVHEEATIWEDIGGSRVDLPKASAKMLAALLRLRLRHSFLRLVVPLFDRLFPTMPIKSRDGLSLLILNWRDIRHPQAGGSESYLHEIAKRWVASGHRVEWLTASFKGAPKHEVIDQIRITRVGNKFTVYAAVALEYILNFRDRFDAIIDSENGIPFFSPLYSMKPKICMMYHVHQRVFEKYLPFPASAIFKWIEARAMPVIYRNTTFVTISQSTRAEMEQLRLSPHPIPVATPGYDARLSTGEKSRTPTIVYLGRLKRYKRIHLLLEAFVSVKRFFPEAKLIIAGDGDALEDLKRLATSLQIEGCTTFEGFVTDERKRALLGSAWIFVSPSEMEGWGISAIEANACGTPVVAFDVPGLREAVLNGESGLLLDTHHDLGEALIALLSDPERLHTLSRSAALHASHFTWDSAASTVLNAIVGQVSTEKFSIVRRDEAWQLLAKSKAGCPQTPKSSPLKIAADDFAREAHD